jgi:hypothetical protein
LLHYNKFADRSVRFFCVLKYVYEVCVAIRLGLD